MNLKSFYIHYITKHNNYKYDSKIIEARGNKISLLFSSILIISK